MGESGKWACFTAERDRLKLRPAPNWEIADRYAKEEYKAYLAARRHAGHAERPGEEMGQIEVVDAVDHAMLMSPGEVGGERRGHTLAERATLLGTASAESAEQVSAVAR